jgi:NADH:ubiquinone oxidoreductase subunit 2 (subunit N)
MSSELAEINHVGEVRKALPTIVFLISTQIAYVVLDLVEAKTRNNHYGIAAGFVMIVFGFLIVILATRNYYRHKHLSTDMLLEFLEGFVYISLGGALTEVRWENNYKQDPTESDVDRFTS